MKEYTVLTVNPGSTGTKVGLVRGDTVIFDLNVENAPGEFASCKTFAEQAPLREKKIYECLAQQGVDLSTIDAVSGRGVGLQSCIGGTYRLNDLALRHAVDNEFNIPHPAVNGIILARSIADKLGKPAFTVNPFSLDELKDVARMTGLKGRVDAVLVTGGLAYDKELTEALSADLSWIAPLYFYPGSFETEALASSAIRVLSGEEEALEYTGEPVWDGFDFAE